MDQREVLGIIAVAIGVVAYSFYLRNIFIGRTRPHAFSWLLWGLLTAIVFAAQILHGGGPGAWVTGVSSIICVLIGLLALTIDERGFALFDWLFLCAALVALLLWFAIKEPAWSIILITLVDVLGYASTLRKAYHRPGEEMVTSFALNSLKYIVGLLALQSYSLVTWMYPAALVIMNGSVVVILVARRRVLFSVHETIT
jgi:hypothetical protein